MTFEPTFESIDHDADALPDLEGNPFGEDAGDGDLAATGEDRHEDEGALAEGGIEAGALESDAPLEELPPYGEQ